MPNGADKSCYTCYFMWEDGMHIARCTRMPPQPLLHDPIGVDATAINRTSYLPVPGIPGCGEWRTNIELEDEPDEQQTTHVKD